MARPDAEFEAYYLFFNNPPPSLPGSLLFGSNRAGDYELSRYSSSAHSFTCRYRYSPGEFLWVVANEDQSLGANALERAVERHLTSFESGRVEINHVVIFGKRFLERAEAI